MFIPKNLFKGRKELLMRSVGIAVLVAVLVACQGNTQEKAQENVLVKSQKDSVSYCIGMDIAKNFKRQSIDIDPAILAQAIKDVLAGGKTVITDDQAQQVLAAYQSRMMANQEERSKVLGDKNKKEGDAYLAENKKKPGVKTTPSGLQYKVIVAGTGPKPKEDQSVSVNYRGTLIDGTEFDSSFKRGTPATFACKRVVKGWTEALLLMPVGSKWQLVIPPELAYGNQGSGQAIGPNATLIFELELLSAK
ncbi:MAG: FKBP-type peptidyl-prolyl cis-trans isomerase [Ignavibacteria bacterium]|nr:MAG: FKBP-type peptidyl-prolyl cis-trans isomerase [Ignavibacteria bacterium]